jgi:hypothetical protein
MKFSRNITLLVVLAALHSIVLKGQVPLPPVYGTVVSAQRNWAPVAGVTVSLVHPILGRNAPVLSGPNGGFYFTNVPPRADAYFIEAYWGNQLLFRNYLYYNGSPVQVTIPIP